MNAFAPYEEFVCSAVKAGPMTYPDLIAAYFRHKGVKSASLKEAFLLKGAVCRLEKSNRITVRNDVIYQPN